jgi:hypothetical protein
MRCLDCTKGAIKIFLEGAPEFVPLIHLGHLKPNDRLYCVIDETEAKRRYILGAITLESEMTPSPFSDQLYFVQHQLDLRRTEFAKSIVNPEN